MRFQKLPAALLALLLLGTAACDSMDEPDAEVEIVDLVEGTGPVAAAEMPIAVHYVGWLDDGTLFDTSRREDRGPFLFRLTDSAVIDGWVDGIEGMRVGGKRQLKIPPELAYGNRGAGCTAQGCVVPPNATLNFEIDLLSVVETEKLVEGEGERASYGSALTVHYVGRLEDGTVFDSSRRADREPLTFVLGAGRVIPGWDYGLAQMRVGSTWKLTVPPEFAYGETGVCQSGTCTIPPNATLTFEVELLDVAD